MKKKKGMCSCLSPTHPPYSPTYPPTHLPQTIRLPASSLSISMV